MAVIHTKLQEKAKTTSSASTSVFTRIISKRRTWATLIILLSSSVKYIISWYSSSAIFAVTLSMIFGLLAIAAALAVAVPATLVTWITIIVLMKFCGKPRSSLVVEGKKLSGEIISCLALKVLVREGKFVAALCAVLGYFALVNSIKHDVIM